MIREYSFDRVFVLLILGIENLLMIGLNGFLNWITRFRDHGFYVSWCLLFWYFNGGLFGLF